jgi:hypothetical protein
VVYGADHRDGQLGEIGPRPPAIGGIFDVLEVVCPTHLSVGYLLC